MNQNFCTVMQSFSLLKESMGLVDKTVVKNSKAEKGWEMAQSVKRLLCKHKDLCLDSKYPQ